MVHKDLLGMLWIVLIFYWEYIFSSLATNSYFLSTEMDHTYTQEINARTWLVLSGLNQIGHIFYSEFRVVVVCLCLYGEIDIDNGYS